MVWSTIFFGLTGFALAVGAWVKVEQVEKRVRQLEDRIEERDGRRVHSGEADEEEKPS